MREAHSRRPEDFRRRIIKRVFTSKEDLVIEEQRWLDMINPKECGARYYNKTLRSTMPSTRGYHHDKETMQKISDSNRGRKRSDESRQRTREATIRQFSVADNRKKQSDIMKSLWLDEKYRINQTRKIVQSLTGRKLSEETKRKIAQSLTGKTHSEKMKRGAK